MVRRLAADDALLTDAGALADELADGAPLVHAATKELLLSTATTSLADGIVAERAATTALFASADGREGFAAFLARRRPNFTSWQSTCIVSPGCAGLRNDACSIRRNATMGWGVTCRTCQQ